MARESSEKWMYSPMDLGDKEESRLRKQSTEKDRKHRIRSNCCICCGVSVCCIIILAVVLWIILNLFVSKWLSAYFTAALETETYAGSANIGLFSASASFDGSTVQNPNGFEGVFATADHIEADVYLPSVFSDPIHLQYLELHGLTIRVSKPQGHNKSNLDIVIHRLHETIKHHRIRVNFFNVSSISHGWMEAQHRWSVLNDFMDRKVIVDRMILRKIKANIHTPAFSNGEQDFVLHIKEISLKDVGTRANGVHLYELMAVILQRLILSIAIDSPAQLASQLYGKTMTQFLNMIEYEEWFDSAEEDLGKGLQTVRNWTHNTANTLGEGIEGVGDGTAAFAEHIGMAFGAPKAKAEDFADKISDAGEKVGDWFKNMSENMNKGSKKFEGDVKKFIHDTHKGFRTAATTGFEDQ